LTKATSRWIEVSGLQYHLNEWDGGGDTTVLCLHGFLDVGANWSFLVEHLSRSDLHIVAPDWRGHGDTEWIGPGGYYHFNDYVRDLHQIVQSVRRDKLVILAHSMGAMVATYWLGAFPMEADALILLEGLGPLHVNASDMPTRMRRWLTETAPFDPSQFQKPMADLSHVCRRLRRIYPRLSDQRLECIARRTTRQQPDGSLIWKYDPLHRTQTPMPALYETALAFWRAVRCPSLWVGGAESPWKIPEVEQWLSENAILERVTLLRAGHMLHYEVDAELAGVVDSFLANVLIDP